MTHYPWSVLGKGTSNSLDGVWWLGWMSVPDLLDDWEWRDLLTCLGMSLACLEGHGRGFLMGKLPSQLRLL